MRLKRRRWLFIFIFYSWWLVLCGKYLWTFCVSSTVSGVDGSAHVAALHLYSLHVYPDVQGWLPEFFGGMSFPVFYPPLFYWAGATLMHLTGATAGVAAKILTVASFIALPGVLFKFGRQLGFTFFEAFIATALAGIILCGLNVIGLFSIGLVGLFEVGLYTHVLGFIWFCLWAGALPHVRRSAKARVLAVGSLSALLLTNIYVLPLAAIYGLSWFVLDLWRAWRRTHDHRRRRIGTHVLTTASVTIIPVMIAGFWLLPFIELQSYALGQTQTSEGIFPTFGLLNVLLLPCLLVVVHEYHQRPAVAALCVTVLVATLVSYLPTDEFLDVPFQPWRLISAALLLAVFPASRISLSFLGDLLKRRLYVWIVSAATLLSLVFLHPPVVFNSAALPEQEAVDFQEIRAFLKLLPPGMALVEIMDAGDRDGGRAGGPSLRKETGSRALAHLLATDGRPTLWAVFREHATSAPLATAVRNLFSTTPESFGTGGLAIKLAASRSINTEEALKLSRHLGCVFYLVKTPEQVDRLSKSGEVSLLREIGGWHIFTNTAPPGPVVSSD